MMAAAGRRATEAVPVYFRTADRMRIEACVSAVAQEGMSLALGCDREALLEHYFDLLLTRLKEVAPQHRIDVYFPSNTESLLARFNEILAEQSLSQAFQSVPVAERALLWIVHDAQSLPAQEVQLLARLIQNLPGANIRAILLLHGAGRHQTSLSTFGRRIVRWDIDVPNEEQAAAALEQARAAHCEARVRQLLLRIGHPQAADSPEDAAPAEAEPPPALRAEPREAVAMTAEAPPRSKRSSLFAVLTLLVIATGVTLWMQPEALDALTGGRHRALIARVLDASGLRQAEEVVEVVEPPAPATIETVETAPMPAESLPAAGPPPSAPAEALAPPAPPLPITVVPQPAPRPVPRAPAKAQSAEAWLNALDPKGFMVQSGSLPTLAQAEQLKATFPDLAEARIVSAWRKTRNDPAFLVLSGPYPSLPHAQKAMRSLHLPQGSWIRTTIAVQEQLIRNPVPKSP